MARSPGSTGDSLLVPRGRKIACDLAGGRCPVCGVRIYVQDGSCTIDHLIPDAKGGVSEGNLYALCGPCNSSKAEHDLHVWLPARLQKLRAYTRRHALLAACEKIEANIYDLVERTSGALYHAGIWSI